MIHGHGDDLYQAGNTITANFSTNVWYEADREQLCTILAGSAEEMFHYPEPDAGSLAKVIAEIHGLQPGNVLVGNGATELFYLIAHAFAGGCTLLPIPSFAEYEDACALFSHQLEFIQNAEVQKLPADAGLMFICNPNNPDGRVCSKEEIRTILEHYSDMMLVVDESLIRFAPEAKSVVEFLPDYPNLLVVRSMTKDYAIPGLRLGYMLGNVQMIEFIRCFKQPWTVNALAVALGKYLLLQGDRILPDVSSLLSRQQQFMADIAAVAGFFPEKSGASFFLVRTDYKAATLKQYLLEQHGILIRDASNFRGLDEHYFRLNTLPDVLNKSLVQALRHYVVEHDGI